MQEFIPAIGVCAVAGNLVLGMIDDQGTKWERGIVDEYMIQGQTHVAFVYLWLLLQITARINAAVQSRNGGCCTQNGRRKREQNFGDLHVGSRMEKEEKTTIGIIPSGRNWVLSHPSVWLWTKAVIFCWRGTLPFPSSRYHRPVSKGRYGLKPLSESI